MRRLVMACTVCAAAMASPAPIPAQTASGPNILLVTIDTLRADRLGAYGYAPRANAHSGRARSIRRAVCGRHSPRAADVSRLTSRSSPGAIPVPWACGSTAWIRCPTRPSTIAERLKSAGYRTGAVIGSVVLDQSYGLGAGFRRLRRRDRRRAAGDDGDGGLAADGGGGDGGGRGLDRPTAWRRGFSGCTTTIRICRTTHPPHSKRARPGRPYDAEIAYVDAELGKLLKPLDRSRTAIVVTSDHGEALGEHGEPDHGFFLYDATLRVPLIVAAPGLKPRVVREQVRLHRRRADDCESCRSGHRCAHQRRRRESACPARGRRSARRAGVVGGELVSAPAFRMERAASRHASASGSTSPRPSLSSTTCGRTRSKRRTCSPQRAPSRAGWPASLQKITSRFTQREPAKTSQPDAATVERLQALGYVGSFAPVTAGKAGEDPKDHIADYRQYRDLFNRALGLLGAR